MTDRLHLNTELIQSHTFSFINSEYGNSDHRKFQKTTYLINVVTMKISKCNTNKQLLIKDTNDNETWKFAI